MGEPPPVSKLVKGRRCACRHRRLVFWRQRGRPTARVVPVGRARLLHELMKGASLEDWALFAELEKLSSFLYWYDGVNDELQPAAVEWPIVWLLVRHNPKHIFISKKGIDLQSVGDHVRQFEQKLKWMWFHRDTLSSAPLLKYKGTTPKFTGTTCPALDAGLHSIRNTVFSYAKRANTVSRAKSCCNTLGLTKWAWEILRQKRYHVFLNDKEPGFTLMTIADAVQIHTLILASSYYKVVQENCINANPIRIEFFKLCGDLAKFEGDDQWYSVLKKSYWNPGSTLIAKLKCNMKTTKPKGKNRVRNLHTCPNSKFACLSMWLNRVIDARLFPYKHLLRDSLHLVDQLRNERLPVGWAMIRIDLDHFSCLGLVFNLLMRWQAVSMGESRTWSIVCVCFC